MSDIFFFWLNVYNSHPDAVYAQDESRVVEKVGDENLCNINNIIRISYMALFLAKPAQSAFYNIPPRRGECAGAQVPDVFS